MTGLTLNFAPLIPWLWLGALGSIAVLMLAFMAFKGISGVLLRFLALTGLGFVLANPSLQQEEREDLDDIVLLMLDQSSSMLVDDRDALFQRIEKDVSGQLAKLKEKQVHIAVFSDKTNDVADKGTTFKASLDRALAELPVDRLSAVIAITDGQVHDLPDAEALALNSDDKSGLGLPEGTPFHVLLVGQAGEFDRVFSVQSAPRYGLVGETVSASVRIDDLGFADSGIGVQQTVRIEVVLNGEVLEAGLFPIGRDVRLDLPVQTAGRNLFELRAGTVSGELSTRNNALVLQVNGVRERLSVLLVSGQPHQSERAWRNLLKSDPSVDLIHFTILRPSEKRDNTPVNELSLIPFPIRELFQDKLYDFDLIIFDQYPRRGILPPIYFNNITRYVQQGGGLFVSAGPEFATTRTIYATGLANVIPGRPTGIVKEQKYTPKVSALGRRHPITNGLIQSKGSEETDAPTAESWGSWVRQIDLQTNDAQVLMQGLDNTPLLLAARRGEGRVVQLGSDNLWLWARGHEGGGPFTEILRRSAHWLMNEPELEEEQLVASFRNGKLGISRQSLGVGDAEVQLTYPSGEIKTITLVDGDDGRATAEVAVDEKGVFILNDENLETRVAVGTLNPKELKDLRSNETLLQPFANATGGSIRAAVVQTPNIRQMRSARTYAGNGWIGVRDRNVSRLIGLKTFSLTPVLLALLLLAGLILWGWSREGKG